MTATAEAAPIQVPSARQLARLGPRGSFGLALLTAAQADEKVVALTADLATTAGLDRFRGAHPDRLVNVGIAEQTLVGMASAFADDGWTPFAVTFANFAALRGAEFVRHHLGYLRAPVTVVGIGAGFVMGQFGTSHYSLEDVAALRSIPNLSIVSPADCSEVFDAVLALAAHPRPCYLRLAGAGGPDMVDQGGTEFHLGQARTLRTGSDVTIVATGPMVSVAVSAAELLSSRGLSVGVVNMHTVKPLDSATLAVVADTTDTIVTLEEHSVLGGLGSAVAEELAARPGSPPLLRIGVPDRFPAVGSYEFVLGQIGLTDRSVAERITSWTRGLDQLGARDAYRPGPATSSAQWIHER